LDFRKASSRAAKRLQVLSRSSETSTTSLKISSTVRGGLWALLTVPAVAKVLKLGRARTYELIRGGDLPGVRVGVRQVRVRRADLIKFMQPQNG